MLFNDKLSKSGGTIFRDHASSSVLSIGGIRSDTGSQSRGELDIQGNSEYYTRIYNNTDNTLTANRTLYIPNKSGTIAVDLEKCTFLKTGGGYSTFQFNKNTSEPSLICCHHDGGSATLVGVWQHNYFATLLSTGQFTVRAAGYTELLIDNTAPYWTIGCISISPVLLTLIA